MKVMNENAQGGKVDGDDEEVSVNVGDDDNYRTAHFMQEVNESPERE